MRPPARVRDVLAVEKVLRVVRVNLADGEPFARVTVWCPEELGADVSRAQVAQHSFHELLPGAPWAARCRRSRPTPPRPSDAELLEIPPSSPVLVCERVTADAVGRPVLVAEYVFPGHRSAFTVDLPHPEVSIGPSGLRLVEPSTGRRRRGSRRTLPAAADLSRWRLPGVPVDQAARSRPGRRA